MEELNRILGSYVVSNEETKGKLPGAALVVVNKDEVLCHAASGRIGVSPGSAGFTPRSFTWIASSTKIITATALMQLVERGLVGLDDDVRPHVSQLAEMQVLKGFDGDKPILENNTKPITLRQLLTHTVGLGYDIADPELIRWSKAVGRTCTNLGYTLDGWFTPLKFAPGEGWYYGSAVDWAGQVLEKITGKSLGEYMAENIFKPLSMEDTTFYRESLPHTEGRQVECSYRDAETGELCAVPHPVPANPPINSGGAGLYTTALDHAKVLQALLKASVSGGIVRKETVDEMFRPQLSEVQHGMLKYLTDMFHDGMVPDFPPGTSIQHGISGIINLEDVPGKRRKGSMMWLGMANSHWFIDRETGIAATLMVNVMPLPDQVVIKLWDELERAIYNDLLPAVR